MLRVTSDSPAQLLQYKPPHSISFIGIPFTITAIFSLLKPRMLIFESPYAPPCLVAYTPGVDFNISGNSCVPNFSSINSGAKVVTATGVLRATAIEEVITTSPKVFASSDKAIVPKSTLPF